MNVAGDFYGLPTGVLENDWIRLEYLASAGPRLVRLTLRGSDQNQLVEVPDISLPTPLGDFKLRGGHRLWTGPEAMPRSYVPDDAGLDVETYSGGVQLILHLDELTGIRKLIDVRLDPTGPSATLRHELRNDGVWPVELAPWAITMLPLGGVAILPQQTGPLTTDPYSLLPNRQLVLWPYASLHDPRLDFSDDRMILLQAKPRLPPVKLGYLNRVGWIAYYRDGVLFRKRFTPRPDEPHVDFGCNAEFYCNDRFIEMESLGPLAKLAPGESVQHVEIWDFTTGLNAPNTADGAREVAGALMTTASRSQS